MSIDQDLALNGHDQSRAVEAEGQTSDSRVPLGNGHVNDLNLNDEDEPKTFDMDFFPTETGELSRNRHINRSHIFGQVENSREDRDQQETRFIGEDEGYERARRRAAGLPIIQRLVHCPLLHEKSAGDYLLHYWFIVLLSNSQFSLLVLI
jgi:hypothetical protein